MYKRHIVILSLITIFISSTLNAQVFTTNDYKKAGWMTARFYGAQRISLKTGMTSNWLLQNHGTATDFNNDNDNGYDLTGGWADCGDHVMFGQTQFYSAYVLLKGFDLWPNGYGDYYSQNYTGYYNSQNYNWEGQGHDPDGIPDILNEVKYATDFFIKAARSNTQFYSQKGQGNYDHKHWVTSVKMATYGTTEGGQPRKMYSNVKDASMASFCAATLALMSRIYRQYDDAYATTCLTHALYAYEFAKANKATAGSPENAFYGANAKWQDDYASMCTELYFATNDDKYKTEALSYENDVSNHYYCFGYNNNDDIAAYNLATLGSTKAASLLNSFATTYKGAVNTKGLYTGGDTTWGTLRYNANAAFVVALNMVFTNTKGVDPFIYKQIDYILGNNTAGANNTGLSFVVGFGNNAVKYPHHRNVYLNDNDVSNSTVISIPARNSQFGYLVGGIRSGSYTDTRDNYTNGEGGIDYSAGLVGAIAYILSQTDAATPTGITVSPNSLKVPLSNTASAFANVTPTNASQAVTWKSSNTSIATVNSVGVVTGIALGSAYIIATTTSGNFKDSTLCTVENINVTDINVSPSNLELPIGATSQLTAAFTPSNPSNKNVNWESSDTNIATVSNTGVVTGVSEGSATITATSVDGGYTSTANMTIILDPNLIVVKKLSSAIVIDGDINESVWNLNKTISKSVSGTQNNTASFGLLWDDTNLYIAVSVIDATIKTNNTNAYDNDAIELFFDMNNNDGAFDASDRQWIKVVNSTNIWQKIGTAIGAITTTSNVTSASKLITGGYTMEFAIPWTTLGVIASTSALYGFDIAYDDADAATTRSNQTVWTGTASNYLDLSIIGNIELSSIIASDPTTDVHNVEDVSFTIYPNPATTQLTLNFGELTTKNNEMKNITITNALGQIIYNSSFFILNSSFNIDVSLFKVGLYFIRIGNENRKFIKQ